MPLISSVTGASFAGVGPANPTGRTNPTRTNPRPTTDAPFFISTTSGADYTTWAIREIMVGEQQPKPSCECHVFGGDAHLIQNRGWLRISAQTARGPQSKAHVFIVGSKCLGISAPAVYCSFPMSAI